MKEVAIPPEGTKGLLLRLPIKALFDALLDDTIKVWREYRDSKVARREDIRRRLDAQKRLPFEHRLRRRAGRTASL